MALRFRPTEKVIEQRAATSARRATHPRPQRPVSMEFQHTVARDRPIPTFHPIWPSPSLNFGPVCQLTGLHWCRLTHSLTAPPRERSPKALSNSVRLRPSLSAWCRRSEPSAQVVRVINTTSQPEPIRVSASTGCEHDRPHDICICATHGLCRGRIDRRSHGVVSQSDQRTKTKRKCRAKE